MAHRSPFATWHSTWPAMLAVLAACVSSAPPPRVYSPSLTPEQEAAVIERAKRHPIAQPSIRPLYPEKSPPPLTASATPAAPPPPSYGLPPDAYPADSGQASTFAPVAPPTYYDDTPRYPSPGANYVWAPGYWGWSGANYSWIGGSWLLGRPGYAYIGSRWNRFGLGWQLSLGGFRPYGAGIGLGYYPSYGYSRGYQPYRTPSYYDARRYESPRYSAPAYRQEVRSSGARESYSPRYSAPSHSGSSAIHTPSSAGHSSGRSVIRSR